MRRPRPKFKVSFYLYFCCFWINVTQINFENIKRKIQRIISDSCFQLNRDLMLMLECPLSHYWTSPFNTKIVSAVFECYCTLRSSNIVLDQWKMKTLSKKKKSLALFVRDTKRIKRAPSISIITTSTFPFSV